MTLTTLIRWIRRHINAHQTVEKQFALLKDYSDHNLLLIEDYERLAKEVVHIKLEHAREIQGMTAAWIISIETPEIDIRQDLHEMEQKLRNQIATLEEHIL